jgi:hypothetical protein
LLLTGLHACAGNEVRERGRPVAMPDRFPSGHIEKTFQKSLLALNMVIEGIRVDEEKSVRTDGGGLGYAALELEGRIVHSYKGGRLPGEIVSFGVVWEYYEGLVEDIRENPHRIVFIKKGPDGDYIGMAFGVFLFAEDLDRSLRAFAERQTE